MLWNRNDHTYMYCSCRSLERHRHSVQILYTYIGSAFHARVHVRQCTLGHMRVAGQMWSLLKTVKQLVGTIKASHLYHGFQGGALVWDLYQEGSCMSSQGQRPMICFCFFTEKKTTNEHLLFSQGMKGQDIMQMLEHNQRLESPDKCPQPAYDIMLRCWSWRYVQHLTFCRTYV